MMKLRYRYKLLLGLAGIVVGIFAVYALTVFSGRIELPPDFLSSRSQVAIVSQQITDLTRATNEKIKAVKVSELSGKPDLAFSFINDAQGNNAATYSKAVELSLHLQKLAQSLAGIKSAKSQRLAYEAVAVEFGLVSEFIIYTQKLGGFLENLSRAIATDLPNDRKAVQASLDEVNLAVQYINQLNNDFGMKMRQLEGSL